MEQYEQNGIRQHYLPYVIAEIIGLVLGLIVLFDGQSGLNILLAGIFGLPFAMLIARSIVACNRFLNLLLGGLFSMGCLTWMIGAAVSLLGAAAVLTSVLRLVSESTLSMYTGIALLDIISVYLVYMDVKRVLTDMTPNIPSGMKAAVISVCTVLALISGTICIHGLITDQSEQKEEEKTDVVEEYETVMPEESQVEIDASYFHPTKVGYCDVVENAMARCLAAEEESRASGDEILEQSSVKAVYFLTMKEPGTMHYDYGDNVTMTNVLLVVTSYRVDIANMVQRDNWAVYAYPNFRLDHNDALVYSQEEVYEDFLIEENREAVYEWICEEYADMTITELVIPV